MAEADLTGGFAASGRIFSGPDRGGISMVVSKLRTDFGAIIGQLTQAERIVQRIAQHMGVIGRGWGSMAQGARVAPQGGSMALGSSGTGMGIPQPTFTSSQVTNPNAWRYLQFEQPPPMPPGPTPTGGQSMPWGNRLKTAVVGAGFGGMAVQQVGGKIGLSMARDSTFYQTTMMGAAPGSTRFGVGMDTARALSGGYMTPQDYLADVGIMARGGVDFTSSSGRSFAGNLGRFSRLTPGMDMGATTFGQGGVYSGQGMNMLRMLGINPGDPTRPTNYASIVSRLYKLNFGNQKINTQDVTRAFRPGSGRLRYSLEHMGYSDDQIENMQQAMTMMAKNGGREISQSDLKKIPTMAGHQADRVGADERLHSAMQRGVVDGFNASTAAMTKLTGAVSHLTHVLEIVGGGGAIGAVLGGSVLGRALGSLGAGMAARRLGGTLLGRLAGGGMAGGGMAEGGIAGGTAAAGAGAVASRFGLGRLARGGLYAAAGHIAGGYLSSHGHSTMGAMASDAGIGAAVGSFVAPGVGTAIGAGVGAAVGFASHIGGHRMSNSQFNAVLSINAQAKKNHWTAAETQQQMANVLAGHFNEAGLDPHDKTAPAKAGSGTASPSGGAIVTYALQFVGIPYKWGGSSPKEGFDCSGFTSYVFGHFGIGLPHSSAAQSRMGSSVSYDQAAPGDLLFWDNPNHVHHVAIYMGGGRMVAAPHTGTSVQVQRVYGKPFVRRVVKGNRSAGGGTPNGASPGQRNFGQSTGVFESGAIAASLSGFSVSTPSVSDLLGGGPAPVPVGHASSASTSSASTSGSSGGSAAASGPANPKGNVALGKKLAGSYGWGGGNEWNSLYQLWEHESSWSNTSQNPHSTAYGIPQFLDSTWSDTGYRKSSDPTTQIKAGLKYIKSRYGDPANAWSTWQSRSPHWYRRGNWDVAEDELAMLHKGEMVVPAPTAGSLRRAVGAGRGTGSGGGGGPKLVTINVYPQSASHQDAVRFARQVKDILDQDDELAQMGAG